MNNDIFSKYVNKDQEKIKQKGRKKLSSFPEHNGITSILASIFYSNASLVSRDSLHGIYIFLLTDSIFETGAYGVPSKSHQLFWVKVVHLVPNVHTLARHAVGAIHLALTTTLQSTQYSQVSIERACS